MPWGYPDDKDRSGDPRNPIPRERLRVSHIYLNVDHIARLKKLQPARNALDGRNWSAIVQDIVLRYLEEHPEI